MCSVFKGVAIFFVLLVYNVIKSLYKFGNQDSATVLVRFIRIRLFY